MVSNVCKAIAYRFYSDFLLPSRLNKWYSFLEEALISGYKVHSIKSLWQIIKNKKIDPDSKYLVIRHDVDTDVGTARQMWEWERRLYVSTSYYFRLSTIDIDLMQAIEAEGGEASYHYEELATYAKNKGFASRNAVLAHLNVIRRIFAQNLKHLRKWTGIPMHIVASHGDWINRKLDLPNWVILEDRSFRQEVEVELEAYDHEFMHLVTSRHSDASYPTFWKPRSPLEAIKTGEPVVYVLVHPRHWRANVQVNLKDNLSRLWENTTFYFKTLRKDK